MKPKPSPLVRYDVYIKSLKRRRRVVRNTINNESTDNC